MSSATGRRRTSAATLIRKTAAFTILGNHDAAVAGRMDYSYYYDAARQALDLHARQLRPENLEWLRGPAVRASARAIMTFCHGSPISLEEFEYIFSVEQASKLPRHLGRARARDVHRPLAPVQVVRVDPRRSVRGRRDQVRDPARASLHHLGRLRRPAARLRQPRELHDLRFSDEKHVRVQARGVRHRCRRPEDLRRRSRAQLRQPALFLGV